MFFKFCFDFNFNNRYKYFTKLICPYKIKITFVETYKFAVVKKSDKMNKSKCIF